MPPPVRQPHPQEMVAYVTLLYTTSDNFGSPVALVRESTAKRFAEMPRLLLKQLAKLM